jgi:GLPGLI family protein
MRLRYLLLACPLLALPARAQTAPTLPADQARLECLYKFTYRLDSTTAATRTETMRLQIGSKLSRFESLNALRGDSVGEAAFAAAKLQSAGSGSIPTINLKGMENPAFRSSFRGQIIYKIPTSKQVVVTDKIFTSNYVYQEPFLLLWTVGPATATVAGYACQRATATWGGRTWEAWFTREVPVAEGPYKFYGLPGLIVKAGDMRNHYVYELIAVRKMATPTAIALPAANTTPIERDKFISSKAEYTRNSTNQMLANGNLRFNTPEEEAAFRQRARERAKRPTNPIELK